MVNWLYPQLIEAVNEKLSQGGLADLAWLAELDVKFASLQGPGPAKARSLSASSHLKMRCGRPNRVSQAFAAPTPA